MTMSINTHKITKERAVHVLRADWLGMRTNYTSVKTMSITTLEATQGQMDGFFSQLPYKSHQNRVASVED